MRKHVGEEPHSCKEYDYYYNNNNNNNNNNTSIFLDALQIHMMTHTGEKPLRIT